MLPRFFIPTIWDTRYKPNTNKVEGFPYAIRDDFLSPSEFSFYKILA